jgi:iron(III) transport system ATP-binding protein
MRVNPVMSTLAMPATPALEVRNANRRFGASVALQDASLSIAPGEFLAVIGRSGSGKSTLLRVLAGLESIDAGEVYEAGTCVATAAKATPAERRNVGLVFQDFALFPHMTVRANVGFGLRGLAGPERAARIAHWLGVVDLGHKIDAYPHQLSGGEQQRVALARALAPQPAALLLDEPFSGLDPSLRTDMQERTIATLKATKTAALLVSHDTEEALAIADRVAVMEAGAIVQVGAPEEIFATPVSLSVARAMGQVWTLPAVGNGVTVSTVIGDFPNTRKGTCLLAGRPDATLVHSDPDGGFTVAAVRGVGQHVRLRLDHGDGHVVWSELHRQDAPRVGTRVRVSLTRPLVFGAE